MERGFRVRRDRPGSPAPKPQHEGDKTMRFIMMWKPADLTAQPTEGLMAAIGELVEDMTRTGVLLATEGLQPSAKGARLRIAGGKVTVTDGPFAETKELIAGYAIVQVQSKDEAIALG